MSRDPRGYRNQNPGNIEDGRFMRSQPGYVGSDGRFAIMETHEDGFRAMASLLMGSGYIGAGRDTLNTILPRYAPKFENDTNGYISLVAQEAGITGDTKLDPRQNPEQFAKVVWGMIGVELGRDARDHLYDYEQVRSGVFAAVGQEPGAHYTAPSSVDFPNVVRSLADGKSYHELDRDQKQAFADMMEGNSSELFLLLSILLVLGGATQEQYANVMNAFGFGPDGEVYERGYAGAEGRYEYTSRGYGAGRTRDYSFSGPTYDHKDNPDDQFGFRGNGSFDGVDKRLAHIIEATAMEFPLRVRVMSGKNGRNKGDHAKGLAVDITLYDQDGNALGNYQNSENWRAYEAFAQSAYLKAQELYPDLTDGRGADFNWGGLFGGAGPNNSRYKYGSNDTMDFRIATNNRFRAGTIMGGLNAQHNWYAKGDLLGGSQPFSQAALAQTLHELESFRLTPAQAAHNRATLFGVGKASGTLTARADVTPQQNLQIAQAQAEMAIVAGVAVPSAANTNSPVTTQQAAAAAKKAGVVAANDDVAPAAYAALPKEVAMAAAVEQAKAATAGLYI